MFSYYLILLERDKKRTSYIYKEVLPKCPFIVFPAIDAIDPSFRTFIEKQEIFKESYKKKALNTQLAVTLSHLSVWQNLSGEYGVIAEDDVKISEQFKDITEDSISTLPNDFDLVYLYVGGRKTKIRPYNSAVDRGYCNWYLICYMVSKKGAEKLIHLCENIDRPIDKFIANLIKKGKLKGFYVKKEYVDTVGQMTSSDKKGLRSNIWADT